MLLASVSVGSSVIYDTRNSMTCLGGGIFESPFPFDIGPLEGMNIVALYDSGQVEARVRELRKDELKGIENVGAARL
jgi:hypothetical protein